MQESFCNIEKLLCRKLNKTIIIIFVLGPVSSMGLNGRWPFAIRLCSPLCPTLFPGPPYPPWCIFSSSSLIFPPVFCPGFPSSLLSLWRYPLPSSSRGQTISICSSSTCSRCLPGHISSAPPPLVLCPAIWHQPCTSISFCLSSRSSPAIGDLKKELHS